MNDWTSGYVSTIGYTHGYYGELNPLHAQFAFLSAGYKLPRIKTACELGFGQGLSTVIHSASSNVSWYGTDFNPDQATYANDLASASNCSANLSDDSFEEYINRKDLPEFDFIALHGIWSWVSTDNRKILIDFIRRKLKLGGVVYISYNTLPGWSTFAPIRQIMTQHVDRLSTSGSGIEKQIAGALDFAQKLLELDTTFKNNNPTALERLENTKKHDPHYLAHEYFNKDWTPTYFSEIADRLSAAKLSYVTSAAFLEHVNQLSYSENQQKLISEIPDSIFRESVKDFMANQSFRRDYWAKGLQQYSQLEYLERFRAQNVILSKSTENIELKVSGNLGEMELKKEIYEPIINFLEKTPVTSIGQIELGVKAAGIDFANLSQAILILLAMSVIRPAQQEEQIINCESTVSRLNNELLSRAVSGRHVGFMASPVLGGGMVVDRLEQLFLAAMAKDIKQAGERADFVLNVFESLGQALLSNEGEIIESRSGSINRLIELHKSFEENRLPLLKRMKII